MGGVLTVVALLVWVIFLIDWKELRSALRQGGWATAVFYAALGVIIYNVLATPGATSAIHH